MYRQEMGRRFILSSSIIGGLFLASCSSSPGQMAATTPSTSVSSTQVAVCTASDLKAVGGWQGATQTMLGSLSFRNDSRSPCSLHGFVKIGLRDQRGQIIHTQTRHGVSPAASGVTNDARIIVLRPGLTNQAFIPLKFSCEGPVPDVHRVSVVLPDGSTLYAKSGGDPWTIEACSPGSGPSVLSVGPVQAEAG